MNKYLDDKLIYNIFNGPINVIITNDNFFDSPTKASMVASIIFVLDKKTDLISAPHALVYFGIVIFFVYFKVKYISRNNLLQFVHM